VGSRAGLVRCEKSRLPPGFDPRTVQPAGSRYYGLRYPGHVVSIFFETHFGVRYVIVRVMMCHRCVLVCRSRQAYGFVCVVGSSKCLSIHLVRNFITLCRYQQGNSAKATSFVV
jgi:hypothetical protein